MTGIIKKATLVGVLITLGACSSMTTTDIRDTKANPKWYADCEQIGSEGFLFWKDKYAYACGMGESKFEQASEAQAYVDIKNDKRTTRTFVEHSVQNTVIREHLEVKRKSYELASTGNVHTYVRIKMPLETFNNLIAEADNGQVSTTNSNSN